MLVSHLFDSAQVDLIFFYKSVLTLRLCVDYFNLHIQRRAYFKHYET